MKVMKAHFQKESVKVDAAVLDNVRKHVGQTGQSIGWFFTKAAEEKLARDSKIGIHNKVMVISGPKKTEY